MIHSALPVTRLETTALALCMLFIGMVKTDAAIYHEGKATTKLQKLLTVLPDTIEGAYNLKVTERAGDLATIEDSLLHREDVIFYGGFEEGYNNTQWRNRWGIPWVNRGPANYVTDNHFIGEKSLRVSYPEGGVGPGETGGQFPMVLANMEGLTEGYYQELYLRYYLKFEEGFDFRLGGKLPGLMGGGNSWSRSGGDQPDGTNGWTLRFMWRRNGDIVVYAYLPPSDNGKWGGVQWGQDIDCDFAAEPGRWHCIEQYVNVGTPGHDDGKLKVWIDGEKMLDIDDMRFWDVENNYGRIGGVYFSTFHGGSSSDWAPRRDSYAQFDGFVMAHERIGEVRREKPEFILDTILLPDGYRGHRYNAAINAASGGLPPYRWYAAGNSLPVGMQLSRDGKMTGFPEEEGNHELIIEAKDQSGEIISRKAPVTILSGEDVNLANGHTISDHSGNFDPGSPVEGLWDGDVSGDPSGSPGAGDTGSLWVEWDLGKHYRISLIRIFGEDEGDWISNHYTVKTRKETSEDWKTLIDKEDCFSSQWIETRLDDSARYLRLEVTGDTIAEATRVRAFEVYAGEGFTRSAETDSIEIIPAAPVAGDTVRMVTHISFNAVDCMLTDYDVYISEDTIRVATIYTTGNRNELFSTADTLELGTLDAGEYILYYYLSEDTSGPETYLASDTITLTVDVATSLDPEITPGNQIRIYPNPASNAINVDLTMHGNDSHDIDIYSLSGQKIRTINNATGLLTIDISSLSGGVYILVLTRENKEIETSLFIKK
ncbi:MAG: T9SS C-terminal target domain-containing protein [Marinilabiliales bacterium]|nr:MAG: T9SS C-terminal target domain-containing protein [Marinilabiliales bacterium]